MFKVIFKSERWQIALCTDGMKATWLANEKQFPVASIQNSTWNKGIVCLISHGMFSYLVSEPLR